MATAHRTIARAPFGSLPRACAKSVSACPCRSLGASVFLFQFAVERQPLHVQLRRQRIELSFDRFMQERDIHRCQYIGLLSERHQLVGEMPVLQTVVEVQVARLKPISELAIQPKFVPVGMQPRRFVVGIEGQQIWSQAFRQCGRGTFR